MNFACLCICIITNKDDTKQQNKLKTIYLFV